MSTSLLYHAFGIRRLTDYVRTDYQGGQVIFTIPQDPDDCRLSCSACGSHEVNPRGHAERRFRTLPIGSRTTVVVLPHPRASVLRLWRSARSSSPSPTPGAATPRPSSATPWNCRAS